MKSFLGKRETFDVLCVNANPRHEKWVQLDEFFFSPLFCQPYYFCCTSMFNESNIFAMLLLPIICFTYSTMGISNRKVQNLSLDVFTHLGVFVTGKLQFVQLWKIVKRVLCSP